MLRVGSEGALELMQAGQFREAGRRLAKEFDAVVVNDEVGRAARELVDFL